VLQMQVMEFYKKKLGADHPYTLASMKKLTAIREAREEHEGDDSIVYSVENSEPVRHSKGENAGRCGESAEPQTQEDQEDQEEGE
jgi:hypothetical protein